MVLIAHWHDTFKIFLLKIVFIQFPNSSHSNLCFLFQKQKLHKMKIKINKQKTNKEDKRKQKVCKKENNGA